MFEGFFRGVQTPAPHQRGPRRSEGSRLRHLRQRLCQSRQTFPARARSRPQVRQTCRVGPDSGKWLSDSKLVAGKPFFTQSELYRACSALGSVAKHPLFELLLLNTVRDAPPLESRSNRPRGRLCDSCIKF